MCKWRLLPALPLFLVRPVWGGEEIVLASPAYWCPFSCEAGTRREGFTVDIIRRIFTRQGIQVRLVNENYSRVLSGLRKGRYTASPSTLRNEAADLVFPEEAVSRNRFCFYTRVDDPWSYAGPDSLATRRIGVIQGYAYAPELDARITSQPQDFHVFTGNDLTTRLIQQLRLGRLDAFIEEENLVGYSLLGQADNIRSAGCLPGTPGYMAISPGHPRAREYARMFDEGIRELRRSGELEKLLASYGLKDWQAPTRQ